MPLGTALYKTCGGKALDGLGGVTACQTQSNSECHRSTYRSETACDKVRGQEGNSPDQQLRSRNAAQCEMKCRCKDSQEVGLEAAILKRVRNSSLVEHLCADNVTGLSGIPKFWVSCFMRLAVGEHSINQRRNIREEF